MNEDSRRSFLKQASLAAIFAAGDGLGRSAQLWAGQAAWPCEPGATLSILRWKRFVQSEEDAFAETVRAFTAATGVKVTVLSESYDDVQPKASVAAHTQQGPDIVWGLHFLPHLFPEKCLDVSDLADYLGSAHGGWVPAARAYGQSGGRWISIPIGMSGTIINYRKSSVEKAGFSKFPQDNASFLELCRGLKRNGTPAGFALGHASGDANNWAHWALWSHGAYLVDEHDKVIIDSAETMAALEYAKQLYECFIPGTASWNDGSNNKAFLAGDLHLTNNGISIYVAAQAGNEPLADDMDHAYFPIGPVGKPTELHLCFPMLAFNFTKYPNACKAFIAFFLESQRFNAWLGGAQGFVTHCLNEFDASPVWTSDPKRTPFRDCAKRTLTAGGIGSVGEKAAAAIADFVVVDMIANYVTGKEDLKNSIRLAERQARRLYR